METIGKFELFSPLVNVTGSFRWNSFSPHPFPAAHIKRKELQSHLKAELGLFSLLFESFPTKNNLGIGSKIMQGIRKMKLLERVS